MNAEPELEELSAYVDQELTGTARQELEAHLEGCETCRRRLAALQQTVGAIKALPVEAPPRAFTVPPMRQQRSTGPGWAWAGGALAAACLLVVVTVGLTHLPRQGGGSPSMAFSTQAHSGTAPQDRYAQAAPAFKTVTVTDPQNSSRQLTLSTGQPANLDAQGSSTGGQAAPAVPANGALSVGLILQGVPGDAAPTSLSDARIRLSLSRAGYEVVLQNPETFTAARQNGAVRIAATYRLSSIGLPTPAAGNYTLRATWQGPDGSTVVLVAEVPVTITG